MNKTITICIASKYTDSKPPIKKAINKCIKILKYNKHLSVK